MSERYTRVFSLPENLYALGSPVIITAGALLKDNQTGKVLAQLKLTNIQYKKIKAVKVKLFPLDTMGQPLGEAIDYQYLDLQLTRDGDFGAKTPIPFPDTTTRAFDTEVTAVVFTDNTAWNSNASPWEPIPGSIPLHRQYDDLVIEQLRLEQRGTCQFVVQEHKDLWLCTCGAVNHDGEARCHDCGKQLSQIHPLDVEGLTERANMRLAEEARQAAEEKAIKEAAAIATKKKTAKILKIAIPVICTVIAFVVLLNCVIIPNSKYNNAVSLMEAGQYEEALAAFESLEKYNDSSEKMMELRTEITYQAAVSALKNQDYDLAYVKFSEIEGYKDSIEQIKETKYQNALSLLDNNKGSESIDAQQKAYDLFYEISEYKDSSNYLKEFKTYCVKMEKYTPAALFKDATQCVTHLQYGEYGNLVSYMNSYTDGRIYTYCKTNRTQYGNWIVEDWNVDYVNKNENTNEQYPAMTVSYLYDFSPAKSDLPRISVRISNDTKTIVENKNNNVIISFIGNATTQYTFYTNGSYDEEIIGGTYAKDVTQHNFELDSQGIVQKKIITSILEYRNGDKSTITETYVYNYDENGNYNSLTYEEASSSKLATGVKKDSKGSKQDYLFNLKYDQNNRLITREMGTFGNEAFEYGKIYCPTMK